MPSSFCLFIMPHTHWDREWYKSMEIFRLRLVEMLDKFLDFHAQGGTFPPFTLDGQVLSALDYLEFKPERQEELSGLAGDGKILAGPWFVQPDLFLSSGEVIVRNLLEGTRAAAALGSCLKCLYIPESSGIISQAPQIMRGFGIEHLVFIRGIGDERISSEYMMEGPDGSMAVATYLVNAYNGEDTPGSGQPEG
jgi:alpha-mannosidase